MALLTHWAFLPPLGGTAHPLSPTLVLFFLRLWAFSALLGLHSRTRVTVTMGCSGQQTFKSFPGPLMLKGHLPSGTSSVFQSLHFSIVLITF